MASWDGEPVQNFVGRLSRAVFGDEDDGSGEPSYDFGTISDCHGASA